MRFTHRDNQTRNASLERIDAAWVVRHDAAPAPDASTRMQPARAALSRDGAWLAFGAPPADRRATCPVAPRPARTIAQRCGTSPARLLAAVLDEAAQGGERLAGEPTGGVLGRLGRR